METAGRPGSAMEKNEVGEIGSHNDYYYEPEYYAQGTSSTTGVAYNLTKTLLGAGIFTFPYVYLKSGFFFALACIILCTLYIYWTANMITRLGDEFKTLKYETVARRTLGAWGSHVYTLCAFVMTFTGMMAYAVIISDNLPAAIIGLSGYAGEDVNFVEDILGSNSAWKLVDRRIVLLLVVFAIILPLCLFKDLKFLSFTSFFGLFYVVFICVISVIKTSINDSRYPENTLTKSELLSVIDFKGLSGAISSAAFANVVQHSQLPFFNSMKSRTRGAKKTVLVSSLGFSTLLILAFSIPTYLNVGNGVQGNILNYFPVDDTLINVTRLAFAFNIILTFPLINYVCRGSVVNVIHGGLSNLSTTAYVAYSVGILLCAVGLSILFCDLGVVVNLSGGLSASLIALVLPQLCYATWKYKNGTPKRKLILLVASTSLGILTFVFTISDTITSILSSSESKVCPHKYL